MGPVLEDLQPPSYNAAEDTGATRRATRGRATTQMRLLLIRHGESEHEVRRIIAEKHCPGLTPRGWKQAELLAERLAATWEVSECQRLLCSPAQCALETAETLAGTLAIGSIDQDFDLCELHPGDADGLSF